jgi:hypothetical protein
MVMKKILFLLLIAGSVWNCKKDSGQIQKIQPGTFHGEKTVYYFSTHLTSSDTITMQLDDSTYSYSELNVQNTLDFGRGNYIIQNDSVQFNDDEARVALYSWSWIISGKFRFEFGNDGVLILNKNFPDRQISCRLNRIFAEN